MGVGILRSEGGDECELGVLGQADFEPAVGAGQDHRGPGVQVKIDAVEEQLALFVVDDLDRAGLDVAAQSFVFGHGRFLQSKRF